MSRPVESLCDPAGRDKPRRKPKCKFSPNGLDAGINPYAYANDNPLRSIDPEGLDALVYDRAGRVLGEYGTSASDNAGVDYRLVNRQLTKMSKLIHY